MNATNGFNVQSKCSACEMRGTGYFCNFSPEAIEAFEKLKMTRGYSKGSRLFSQGQPADGIYVLCQGKAKLSICSNDGKAVILRIARPGEALGLSSVLTEKAHHDSAETLDDAQINFVARQDFAKFQKRFPEAAQSVLEQLNRNYERACEQIRALALAGSTAEKLARLLISLLNGNRHSGPPTVIETRLTHEELGAMINTSRETITRQLSAFKASGLISKDGSRITVNDVDRLSRLADERVIKTPDRN
jgi:CRP/FNR family transcriptional regulator